VHVSVKILDNVLVGINDLMKIFWCHLIPQPGGGRSDDTLRVELVGVGQMPTEGLGVVWLVRDISQNEDPWFG
jgi:hypothetical protein